MSDQNATKGTSAPVQENASTSDASELSNADNRPLRHSGRSQVLNTLSGVAPPVPSEPATSEPHATAYRQRSGTLIGIAAPASESANAVPSPASVPCGSSAPASDIASPSSAVAASLPPAASRLVSNPPQAMPLSIAPRVPDDDEDWDAEPTQQRPSVLPHPISSAPPTLENDEENWDKAFEQAKSQPAIPLHSAQEKQPVAEPIGSASHRSVQGADPEPAVAKQPASTSGGRRLVLLVLAAALVGGVFFFLRVKGQPSTAPSARSALSVAQQPEIVPSIAIQAPAEPQPSAMASAPTGAVSEDGPSGTTRDVSPAADAASDSDKGTVTTPSSPSAPGLIVVTVTTVPPDARFFYKGKAVGHSPFVVELKPGERRSFEIGRPGYHARKVVVDGKKTELTVAMRPDARGANAPPQ